jgi:hypothetical protein
MNKTFTLRFQIPRAHKISSVSRLKSDLISDNAVVKASACACILAFSWDPPHFLIDLLDY